MGVNSLPKTVTRQRRGCDLNPGRTAPESSTITTRLPSHLGSHLACRRLLVIYSASARVCDGPVERLGIWLRGGECMKIKNGCRKRAKSDRSASGLSASHWRRNYGDRRVHCTLQVQDLYPCTPHGGYGLQVKDAAYIKILSKRL